MPSTSVNVHWRSRSWSYKMANARSTNPKPPKIQFFEQQHRLVEDKMMISFEIRHTNKKSRRIFVKPKMYANIYQRRTSSWRWIIENWYLLILLITSSLKLFSICLDFQNESRNRVGQMENMIELILKCDFDGRVEMNIYRRKIPHEKTERL